VESDVYFLGVFQISLSIASWGEFAGTSTPGKIGNCFECFSTCLPHCVQWWISIIWKWEYNNSQIDGSNNCFSRSLLVSLALC